MVLYRFLFAPTLLALAVLAGAGGGDGRRKAGPPPAAPASAPAVSRDAPPTPRALPGAR